MHSKQQIIDTLIKVNQNLIDARLNLASVMPELHQIDFGKDYHLLMDVTSFMSSLLIYTNNVSKILNLLEKKN